MRVGSVWSRVARVPWRFLPSALPWLALVYLVMSALLGVALVLLAVFTFLLLPLWGLVVGAIERRRGTLLGFPRQPSGHVRVSGAERHHWLGIRLTESATWRETAALLVDLVLGLIALIVLFFEAVIVTVLGFVAHAGVTGPTPVELLRGQPWVMTPLNWWPVIPIGLLFLCACAYLNTLLAATQASVLSVLCGPRQRELDETVARLRNSRVTLIQSFEADRRRIERDLHDGVQQELIALGARLGMIGLEVEELSARGVDTTEVVRSVDLAQDQAVHAMAVLRDTVRGIHPSVLTDHGLHEALRELAERTPIPVTLDVASVTLPASTEAGAYYFVTEALNNSAKHSGATQVHIRSTSDGDTFLIEVTDDGRGGADEGSGTGIRGLRERAETMNGHFDINSPTGGPTVLRMELPATPREGGQHEDSDR